MTASVLDNKVLVLNRNWMPINVTTVFDAVCHVYGGRALFVDHESYATHDFDSWVKTWQNAITKSKIDESRVINCSRFGIVAPEVITYCTYKGMGYGRGKHAPKFSRRNIYLRDRNQCQYCGQSFSSEDLNLDHVTPKSRGGQMTWTNIVLSCVNCNTRKGNRTPKEAGMCLIRQPQIPSAGDLQRPYHKRIAAKVGRKVPMSWEQFLGKMYWNVELKD